MKKNIVYLILLLLGSLSVAGQSTVQITGNKNDIGKWISANFRKGVTPPFSFVYGGKHSGTFIKNWSYSVKNIAESDPSVIKRIYSYKDPVSGLTVECEVKGFNAYNAVEWVLRFVNTGNKNTPEISSVNASDITFTYKEGGALKMHYADGSHVSKEDFHQRLKVMQPHDSLYMEPYGGRSSQNAFPFFNMQAPKGQGGVLAAIGWTGTWFAKVKAETSKSTNLKSGMVNLKTYLYPKESIRTPKVCLLFWNGENRFVGHNAFRRLVLEHYTCKQNGKPTVYPVSTSFNYGDPAPCNEYTCMTEDYAIALIKRYAQYKLVPDVFWLDAGWYIKAADVAGKKNWANTVGNWTIDPERFPRGFRPIADEVHKQGAKFMVWFEPERVMKNSDWANQYPQWMLDAKGSVKQEEWQKDGDHDAVLFNLGNAEACKWLGKFIGDFMETNGIDYYRQDFNIEPAGFWYNNDEEGRRGICEIRYIEGLYKFWEYLLNRFPNTIIDNCASGGRRIDLESISRSAALWRTDYNYGEPNGSQCHTYGLELYLPLHGTGIQQADSYTFRSGLGTSVIYNWKVTEGNYNVVDMRNKQAEFNEVRPYFYEDYYPLSGSGDVDITADNIWMVYQLYRPSDDSGYIVGFRRANSPDQTYQVKLQGLKLDREYTLTNKDTGAVLVKKGSELAKGFEITLDQPRSSLLMKIEIKP
ncbi:MULTISPECIES: glycoside hydrolase family 36 protein [Dysgonomonas]|uniref:glycoside hydrolase family 36 protein n=1 Tax=Dysgonomonas TaxID=156973 RepID=UPI0009258DA9|nr:MULTISPECIES: glycoside hydrolase family 36 protein [Dysgonomonas]MBN9302514.1 alpha-galactosidase [Dysgonomonas mossii]OJX58884.1 MAG: alpha-galactosidase [Dysgonomonas sp. 37-18]